MYPESFVDFYQCPTERTSCRAFLPSKGCRNILESIIAAANQSPSYMNSQPWEVFAVSGNARERLMHELFKKAANSLLILTTDSGFYRCLKQSIPDVIQTMESGSR